MTKRRRASSLLCLCALFFRGALSGDDELLVKFLAVRSGETESASISVELNNVFLFGYNQDDRLVAPVNVSTARETRSGISVFRNLSRSAHSFFGSSEASVFCKRRDDEPCWIALSYGCGTDASERVRYAFHATAINGKYAVTGSRVKDAGAKYNRSQQLGDGYCPSTNGKRRHDVDTLFESQCTSIINAFRKISVSPPSPGTR